MIHPEWHLSPDESQLYNNLTELVARLINEGITDAATLKKVLKLIVGEIEDVEYGRTRVPTQRWKRRPTFRKVMI